MDCPECERLRIERDTRKRIYELASRKLDAAAARGDSDSGHYIRLNTLTAEARLDLDQLDAELAKHQGRHSATE